MKTIIAGTREVTDIEAIRQAVKLSGFEITEVVSGASRGVDRLGETWARETNISVRLFHANWEDLSRPDALIRTRPNGRTYDAKAGLRRNQQMVEYAEALIAVWDGYNRGTKDTIRLSKEKGLRVFIYGRPQPGMQSAETGWWTLYSMRWQTPPSVELLRNEEWVAMQWHRTRGKHLHRASLNILIGLCDKAEWITEPSERLRIACPKCKTSADFESLRKAHIEARGAYEDAKSKYIKAKAKQERRAKHTRNPDETSSQS